jgi:PAS domain S-box-containing protein
MDLTPTIEKVVTKTTKDNSLVGMESPDRPYPMFGQPLRIEGLDEILTLHKQTLIDLRTVLKDDIQRAQNVMENLEKKTEKLNILSEEIETRRKNLIEDEKIFRNRLISLTTEDLKVKPVETSIEIAPEDKAVEKKINPPTMLDDFLGSAAIVKRGVLKQVSQPFVDLLGYDSNTLLEKNLVDLIAPERLPDFEKDYADKLRGKLISSYETVLLTKDNKKIHVEITIKPIVHDKKPVDLLLVRKLNK